MGRIGRRNIHLTSRRYWDLYTYRFSLVVYEGMFFLAAEDRCDVLFRFAQIASMALMDFKALNLDGGRG